LILHKNMLLTRCQVGTGTGSWAIDVGEQYPSAHGKTQRPPEQALLTQVLSVVGIDLSPIQPAW